MFIELNAFVLPLQCVCVCMCVNHADNLKSCHTALLIMPMRMWSFRQIISSFLQSQGNSLYSGSCSAQEDHRLEAIVYPAFIYYRITGVQACVQDCVSELACGR